MLSPRSRPIIHRLRAIVVYLSLTCRVLTIVRVSYVDRYMFSIVVNGATCIIIRIRAIESQCSTLDGEVFDIVEEVGLHQGGQAGEILQSEERCTRWEAVRNLKRPSEEKQKHLYDATKERPQGNPYA